MNSVTAGQIWWEVHLRAGADPTMAELAAAIMRESAAAGLAEAADGWFAYLPAELVARALAAQVETQTGLACSVRAVADEQWSAWRYAFQPIDIGARLRVVPVYDPRSHHGLPPGDAPVAGRVAIYIEPGLAFGTGEHPTTASCLRFLGDVLSPGDRVLDVGTGSGILAIGAAALGAASCLGIDIDPVACRSAETNLSLNPAAVGRVRFVCADAAWLGTPGGPEQAGDSELATSGFAVVLANLTTDAIVALLPSLRRQLAPGGALIVSGISVERAGELDQPAEAAGLAFVASSIEHGWLTLLCKAVPQL